MAQAFKTIAVVAGVAALAVVTGGAAAGLGLSLGTTILGTSISAGTLLAGSALASTAAGLLTKGPKVPASQTDRLTANIDPRAFRKTVLGSTAFPIDVRYEEWSGADQEYCDWIVALASHAIDGVDEIWLNTDLAWSRVTGVTAKYAGYFSVPSLVTEGSPANAFTFASGRWNGSARLTGCAYARLRFKVTGNGKKATSPFSSGIPSRITIIGRGAKLYDPRRDSTVPGGSGPMRAGDQSTWRYTADDGVVIGENLPLHVLRVVMGWRIRNPSTGEMKLATGSGVPARRLNLASWIVAANLADEAVNRSAGGTEPRYQGAGVVSEGDDPQTVLDALCAACCGRFRDTGGKLSFSIAHDDLAAAATDDGLMDDDVVGPFQWNPDASLAGTPNVVRGRYVDATAASLYQLIDFPEVRLASVDGQDRVFSLDLGFVESPSQAQRVAKQVLQRKQYPREFTAPFDIRAWKYSVGDVVPFTFATLSFNRKLFRVKDQELGQGGVCNMTLTVETRAIYAFDKDDAAPVVGAEPNVYDASKNPLILAIDDAGRTAEWPNIADTIGTKPEDNATVGAPIGTKVGDRPVTNLLSEVDQTLAAIDALEGIYGDTASAAASAEKASLSERAAAASERAAASAQAIADKARTDAVAAFAAADAARGDAVAKALAAAASAGAAHSSASTAEGYRNEAGEKATAAQGSASVASTSAGNAYASEGRAATSERNASGSAGSAAGSASSASTQAVLSATSAQQSAQVASGNLVRKPIFRDGNGIGWATAPTSIGTDSGSGMPPNPGFPAFARFTARDNLAYTGVDVPRKDWSGRKVRIRALMTAIESDFPVGAGIFVGDAYDGIIDFAIERVIPARQAGWVWIDYVRTLPAGAASINPWVWVKNDDPPATSAQNLAALLAYFEVTDVTDSQAAAASASAANTSAATASTKADAAGEAASAANRSENNAATAAGSASTSAGSAATSERNAAGSSNAAAEYNRLAALSEGAAGRSASAAATSASTATTKAGEAGESASASSTSATNASTYAGQASSSAGAASGSAGAAAGSAGAAGGSAGAAAGSAREASTSASTASTQASNASRDASNAYTYSLTSAGITEGLVGAEGKVTRLESTVTQNTSAIAALNGDGSAQFLVETVSGNNRAQLRVYAKANGGAGVDIVGDTTFRGKLGIGLDATGPRTVITDTYTMYVTGSIMSVYGIGFGSSNQFLEWVGPVKSSLGQCTEADAIRYIRTDGSAYFGGSLNAGTIINPKRTTSLDANASITTGNFGSNGRRRIVTVSYEYYSSTQIYNQCPAGIGQPSVVVDIYRGTEANGAFLDSRTINGTYQCDPGFGQYEPGGMTEQISGSFNITDDSGGNTAAYFARIRNRNDYMGPQQQTLSLISVEQ